MKTEIMKRELKRNKVWGKKELALVRIFFSLAPDFVIMWLRNMSRANCHFPPTHVLMSFAQKGKAGAFLCLALKQLQCTITSYTHTPKMKNAEGQKDPLLDIAIVLPFFFFFFGMCQGIQFRLKFILFNINPTKNSSKVVIKHDCCSHMLETSY